MPLLTLLLVAATVVAYGLELALGGLPVCEAFGLIPATFVRTGDLTPVFTALFLHDPSSAAHLIGNMAFLVVFGAVVEGALGSVGFGLVYAAAGLAGGLLHVLVDPSTTAPLVGASGAIAGVVAVAAALRPRFLLAALVFGGMNVWDAFSSGGSEGVSFGAHLGGFAAGVVFAGIARLVNAGTSCSENTAS